jgi:hypothetical protein
MTYEEIDEIVQKSLDALQLTGYLDRPCQLTALGWVQKLGEHALRQQRIIDALGSPSEVENAALRVDLETMTRRAACMNRALQDRGVEEGKRALESILSAPYPGENHVKS